MVLEIRPSDKRPGRRPGKHPCSPHRPVTTLTDTAQDRCPACQRPHFSTHATALIDLLLVAREILTTATEDLYCHNAIAQALEALTTVNALLGEVQAVIEETEVML